MARNGEQGRRFTILLIAAHAAFVMAAHAAEPAPSDSEDIIVLPPIEAHPQDEEPDLQSDARLRALIKELPGLGDGLPTRSAFEDFRDSLRRFDPNNTPPEYQSFMLLMQDKLEGKFNSIESAAPMTERDPGLEARLIETFEAEAARP